MSPKRKVQVFLVVVGALYLLSTSYGVLGRDSGKSDGVMAAVGEAVGGARKKIQKEMDKPFLLRLFGSKSSMEGNAFGDLKGKLQPVMKKALPDVLKKFSKGPPPSSSVSCSGFRFAAALICLRDQGLALEEVFWNWDDRVEEQFVQMGGTVLRAELTESQGVRLVIQIQHDFTTEEGLGATEAERQENLARMEQRVAEAQERELRLYEWLLDEDAATLDRLEEEGFSIPHWCDSTVPYIERVED